MKTTPFGTQADVYYMRAALMQARRAALRDEVPVGAVVVDENGAIIARGYNLVERRTTQTAHAEMIAINRACKKRNDWRLTGCWLYVTLEPCAMCMGLVRWSRLDGIVYGAQSPLFGVGLDTDCTVPLYRRDAVRIIAGVCAQEAAILLKQFFQQKRDRNTVVE